MRSSNGTDPPVKNTAPRRRRLVSMALDTPAAPTRPSIPAAPQNTAAASVSANVDATVIAPPVTKAACVDGGVRQAGESGLAGGCGGGTLSWVFNWRADGWGGGLFDSETHDFGMGVQGRCLLTTTTTAASVRGASETHRVYFKPQGINKCRAHVTFTVLDRQDKPLLQVCELGTAANPCDLDGTWRGAGFKVSAEQKAESSHATGEFRVRAAVRLFLD
jgi:hypothetical protein